MQLKFFIYGETDTTGGEPICYRWFEMYFFKIEVFRGKQPNIGLPYFFDVDCQNNQSAANLIPFRKVIQWVPFTENDHQANSINPAM